MTKKITTQDEFDDVYDFYRGMVSGGVDHIRSPCHPLRKYKKYLYRKMIENGEDELISRLKSSEERF